MSTKVKKWGNSLAVRLPKDVAESASLQEGSRVEFSAREDELVIRRVRDPEMRLGDFLDKLDPETIHKEVDWGPPVGKEVW